MMETTILMREVTMMDRMMSIAAGGGDGPQQSVVWGKGVRALVEMDQM